MFLISNPLGQGLAAWSYDLPFVFGPRSERTNNIVLVAINDLVDGQESPVTDRNRQALLIERLNEAGAKLIFLDLTHDTEDPEVDDRLISVMRNASNVVLAAGFEVFNPEFGVGIQPVLPLQKFRDAALGLGYASLGPENSIYVCRKIYADKDYPNVNHVVSALLGSPAAPSSDKWIRYYGRPEEVFPTFRFDDITDGSEPLVNLEDVAGKIVYVGANRIVFDENDSPEGHDRFPTPYSRFGGTLSPGFAIHANVLENLLSADSMKRMSHVVELLVCLAIGSLATLLLLHLRLDVAIVVSILVVLLISLSSMLLVVSTGIWWTWLVPAMVQVPFALLAATVVQVRNPRRVRTKYDVFLSYRREGGSETARLLQRELTAKKIRTFLDVVELGADKFGPQLLQHLVATPNFVIILTPGTLDRCNDPDDWVRQEIEEALRVNANIIPILKDGFQFPPVEELPEAIRRLPEFNGITYSHELFDSTLEKLRNFLR